ncbi:DNA internalization-related competence protein ComEC/Rec2 [Saccharothrix longispora]|uniref:Competence protein ComEC n=1 Tax=Saccharothrix longispora TaxID=33920 RepID=A0ABU1Q6Z0_9PSEU|nr:DNA internalization-related competence protein ComEC/Rec2 [Saccharothrix longispora]MDR6598677.1 competence protein ComEC [Saccharothrix longispora]
MTPRAYLVPAALAVWATALAGLLWTWWAAVVVGLAAAAVGGVVLRPWRQAALAVVVVGPVTACWIGLQVHASAHHPLRAQAERGGTVTLEVELDERPRGVHTSGFASRAGGVDLVVAKATLDDGGRVVVLAPAARWSELLPGQRVTAKGGLAPPRGRELAVAVLRVRGPPVAVTGAPAWQRGAEELRAGLREASTALDPEPAGLLPALVVGDTSTLAPRVVEEFRTAGLAHLLAVSGANLAILCGAVLLLLRLARVGPRGCAAGAMVALVGFVLLAGPEPSVLRAAVMGAVALLALVLGREKSALPALAAAVVVLVLYDPDLATAPGFGLSVVATAALVLLAPRWAAAMRARGVPVGLAEALAVPVAANLATAPLVAGFAGQVSLVAVPANLLVAPVVAPVTVLGVVAAVLAPVHGAAARLVVEVAGPAAWWLIGVGRHAAAVPGAAVGWPEGWSGGAALAAVVVLGCVLVRWRRVRALVVAGAVGAALVVVPLGVVSPGWPVPGWSAVACDVGQGDAVVLATADRDRAVLVDTGPDPGPVLSCLRRLGVRRVPLVVLSHLHADHVGGLAAVLAEREVGAVAVGPSRRPEWAWEEVRARARAAGVRVVELGVGQRVSWPGLDLDVLGPRAGPVGKTNTAVNDASLVLRATTPAGRVLLTGDVELAGQADLLGGHVDLRADVLKVPHHGSRYTSPAFLEAVRPRIALVSVGAGNRYGHPSGVLVDALARRGVLVLRTDRDGDTAVLTGPDGPRVARRGGPDHDAGGDRDGQERQGRRVDQASRGVAAARWRPGRGVGAVAARLHRPPVAARRAAAVVHLLRVRRPARWRARDRLARHRHRCAPAHRGGLRRLGVPAGRRDVVRRRPRDGPGGVVRRALQPGEVVAAVAAVGDRVAGGGHRAGRAVRAARADRVPAHRVAAVGRDRAVSAGLRTRGPSARPPPTAGRWPSGRPGRRARRAS